LNVYSILFKHKRKIAIGAVAGLVVAAILLFALQPPIYESNAKLLVRYIVDRSAVDAVDGLNGSASTVSAAALDSEVEILTSWDLYEQVAETIGIERLMPDAKGTATKVGAAQAIASGLMVSARGGGVIVVSYKNTDPALTVLVLEALLKGYFTKHLEIHRSKASFDLISQQNELLRAELAKTEDDLKKKKAEAAIISVSETAATINSEVASTEHEVNVARTELARQSALVAELEKLDGAVGGISKGTDHAENGATHPGTGATNQDHRTDVSLEKARLASLEAGMQELERRFLNVQERAKEFARIAPEIEELERDVRLLQERYTTSRSKLESVSVDEALDPSKIPNISTVQKPSPAKRVGSTFSWSKAGGERRTSSFPP